MTTATSIVSVFSSFFNKRITAGLCRVRYPSGRVQSGRLKEQSVKKPPTMKPDTRAGVLVRIGQGLKIQTESVMEQIQHIRNPQ